VSSWRRIRRGLALLAPLLVAIAARSAPSPIPAPQGNVSDFARVLGSPDRDALRAAIRDLRPQGVRVAVAVIRSAAPETVRQWATRAFERWGVGERGRDNGLLVVLSTGDRRVEVEVGYGLEGRLPDARVGRLLDLHAVPRLRLDDWGGGLLGFLHGLRHWLETGDEGRRIRPRPMKERPPPPPREVKPMAHMTFLEALPGGSLVIGDRDAFLTYTILFGLASFLVAYLLVGRFWGPPRGGLKVRMGLGGGAHLLAGGWLAHATSTGYLPVGPLVPAVHLAFGALLLLDLRRVGEAKELPGRWKAGLLGLSLLYLPIWAVLGVAVGVVRGIAAVLPEDHGAGSRRYGSSSSSSSGGGGSSYGGGSSGGGGAGRSF